MPINRFIISFIALKAYCHFKDIKFKWFSPSTGHFSIVSSEKKFSVSVESEDKAKRYMGVTISNLSIKPSPVWLQNRLRAIGIEPKNNVVDVTNFVLHHMGQPLHAFDLDKIKDGIVVKTVSSDTPFVFVGVNYFYFSKMAIPEYKNSHFKKMVAWSQILQIAGNSTLLSDTHESRLCIEMGIFYP